MNDEHTGRVGGCVWLGYCIFANGEALVLFALKIYGLAIGGALGIGLVVYSFGVVPINK